MAVSRCCFDRSTQFRIPGAGLNNKHRFQEARINYPMPIRLAQVNWISRIRMRQRAFVQVPVGRRLHPGGDLQQVAESYHRPEPAVESEYEREPVLTG